MTFGLKTIRTHLLCFLLAMVLLIVIGMQALPSLWEITADIPDKNNAGSYRLRMLASGDLVFEKHKFLPLASYHDYWGDMTVSSVNWIEDRKAVLTMNDGTQLIITLGNIEIIPTAPPTAPQSADIQPSP